MMGDVENTVDARQVIAHTLRQVAGWGSSIIIGSELDKLDTDELYRLADEVEHGDPADWWCCPLCEEVTCDDDCPLVDIRSSALDEATSVEPLTFAQQFVAVFDEINAMPRRLAAAMSRWARDQHAPFDLAGDGTGPAMCRCCKAPWPCDEYVRLDARLAALPK